MYDTKTRTAFVEFRAKGWSIKRIAARLKIAPRTLVDWNRQDRDDIRTLRALELEALQEKILATREQELRTLKNSLDAIQQQIALRDHKYTSLENLYRLAAQVRAEIRKVCQTPDFSDPSLTEPLEAAPRQAPPAPDPGALDAMTRAPESARRAECILRCNCDPGNRGRSRHSGNSCSPGGGQHPNRRLILRAVKKTAPFLPRFCLISRAFARKSWLTRANAVVSLRSIAA